MQTHCEEAMEDKWTQLDIVVDSCCTLCHLHDCILSDVNGSMQTVPMEAEVQGKIPSWLHGSFVRNGPGSHHGMKHLFDGYAMLVKFAFENGSVKVSHR